MSDPRTDPVWVENPWADGTCTQAEVQMGGFRVRVIGNKGRDNWWWEVFHDQNRVRSLRQAKGGGRMTEIGAKSVALGVLGVAIYSDGEK